MKTILKVILAIVVIVVAIISIYMLTTKKSGLTAEQVITQNKKDTLKKSVFLCNQG